MTRQSPTTKSPLAVTALLAFALMATPTAAADDGFDCETLAEAVGGRASAQERILPSLPLSTDDFAFCGMPVTMTTTTTSPSPSHVSVEVCAGVPLGSREVVLQCLRVGATAGVDWCDYDQDGVDERCTRLSEGIEAGVEKIGGEAGSTIGLDCSVPVGIGWGFCEDGTPSRVVMGSACTDSHTGTISAYVVYAVGPVQACSAFDDTGTTEILSIVSCIVALQEDCVQI